MLSVPAFEMDITHACNLHCEGCTHYSNYGLKGILPFATGREWLTAWAQRLEPKSFSLLGGETTINPELCQYIELAAGLWPDATRYIVSNGFFVDRHEDLFKVLAETNTRMDISLHSRNPKYIEALSPKIEIIEEGRRKWGVEISLRPCFMFYYTYQGSGHEMRPFNDGNPRRSWEICFNKKCKSLHLGRIWKCPPIAFLRLVADKFNLHECEEWRPYLAYEGIGLEASDEELEKFFSNEEERICSMCPNNFQLHEKSVPDF